MGVETALIALAAASTVHQVEQSKTAERQGKREMKKQQNEAQRMEQEESQRQYRESQTAEYRKARARQRAMAGGNLGRQGTMLGGAANVGNQAQSGAGKTLLGV